MPPAEHFAAPPEWQWWILGYFFFGGISGGSYALGTLLRFAGDPRDQGAARIAFIASFLALIPCPVFLTLDLGQPLRFWHMLIDTSEGGLAFKYWSPMSLGSWALLVFGVFSFVSFLGAIAEAGWLRAASPIARVLRGGAGLVWSAIGTLFGLFICGYTGVLLAVSNQVVWSDAGWALGGMFLASALSGSAALLLLVARSRRDVDTDTATRLEAADRYFVILEAILIAIFLLTIAIAGTIGKVLGIWIVLWLVVALGLLAPFAMARWDVARRWPPVAAPLLALLGVLALRAVVIFSAQS
ncbi:MAG TPA: NrfD/PsrC family molybdoenzyme membrane anchor subunit [Candidatus Limnocylindria bacterium]|jgi:Ni/Fe-hydrogenase subunit HybB-like protein|nr:NrfD/PsrC family molybdoenzyme membrane anchor subunit [Candidatus Limnocylindria bacterium]